MKHPQDRVLIIGLGGGGMVRFLNHHFPPMVVEAVEIDPVVVQLAKSHFGVKEGPLCKLHTADAFEFVPSGTDAFDCIYFDAFLRAPEDWGVQEKALRLKTKEFLSQVRDRVTPGGVVAFNIIPTDPGAQQDIATIREVFPGTLRFAIPHSGNEVLLCLLDGPSPAQADLEARAIDLDKTLSLGFSFAELLKQRLE